MRIKQYTLGSGKPLICIPVTETGKNEIYEAAEQAAGQAAQALEWRMDWFVEVGQWNQVEEVLGRLAEVSRNMVLLCTFRSKQQGGQKAIAEQEYVMLLQNIAKSGMADLLDVEVSELSNAPELIASLHSFGQRVIGSQHYFSHTPDMERMRQELRQMESAGADIGKLAVMPKSPLDVLRLMEVTACMREENPGYPLVAMAMGGLGAVSRIGGQLFGSCMTFASAGTASAPGQLPVEDTDLILNKISESMNLK